MTGKFVNDGSARVQLETADRITLDLTGYLSMPGGWQGNAHAHPFWELIYIAHGSGTFTGVSAVPAAAHGVYVFPPDTPHRFSTDVQTGMLYLGFSFSLMPARTLRPDLPVSITDHPALIPFTADLKSIARDVQEHGDTVLSARRLFLLSLIANVVEMLHPPLGTDSRHGAVVAKIKDFIAANVSRNITLADIAENFYLSPHYAADIFKQEAGVSMKAFHHTLRMRRALELLTAGGRSVTDVADELGFENIHHFSKRFKEYYSMPPTKARRHAAHLGDDAASDS